jgi:YD repeat-containing protein
MTDPKTNSTSLTYDPLGNVIAVTQIDRSDVTGGSQTFNSSCSYDAMNRCVRIVDNVGNTNRYFYDSLSRVVRMLDPNGNATFQTWDDLGNRTLVVVDLNNNGLPDLAADANQSWSYDDNSRCIATTDDNTNTTSYAYDSRDRLIATTEADNTACSLVWSPRSNLLRQQDANGTVISNSFDGLSRCISREITPGAGVASTTTFERYAYDGLSRLTAASNDVSLVTIGYDSFGNLDSVTENGHPIHYTYDGVGNRTSITYPSGTVVGYTFDACDQVSQITRCEGCGNPWLGNLVATYAYEGAGRVGRITSGNGINTRVNWDGISGTANPPGDFGWRQVNGVNHQVGGGGTTIDRRMFGYDRNQNKILRAQVLPFNQLVPPSTNQFAYDALDRLVAFTRASGTANDVFRSYMLDGNGNRLAAFSNGLAQPYFMDNTPPPGAADFQEDQYTSTPFGDQTFDENGNLNGRLSSAGQLQFQYDYASRLVAVNDLSGGFPSPIATFAYDALGRRVSKTDHPLGLPPVTTEYVHDGPDDGSDCDDKDPKVIETRVGNIVGKDFILDGSRSSDDEVARLVSGQPQYFHRDELGNVLALTDASGNVIERYDYDDFGAPIFLTSDGFPSGTNGSPADNSLLFHSMEWDSEVSLYTAHSQCAYDPFTGRYLLRAGVPLKFEAATSFAGDNPWSLKKEEGGRHTPFHNKYRPGGSSAGLAREVLKSFFEKGDHPTQALTREVLKTFFEKGDKPTQAQKREPLKTYFETGDQPTQQQ